MNTRLEIASRTLPVVFNPDRSMSSNADEARRMADALIKECGDQPAAEPIQTGLGPELKAAALARVDYFERKYLDILNEHNRLRTDCKKLVEEWRAANFTYRANELEAVLKGGGK